LWAWAEKKGDKPRTRKKLQRNPQSERKGYRETKSITKRKAGGGKQWTASGGLGKKTEREDLGGKKKGPERKTRRGEKSRSTAGVLAGR